MNTESIRSVRCDVKACPRDALLTLTIETARAAGGKIRRTRCLRHQYVYTGDPSAKVIDRVYHQTRPDRVHRGRVRC